MRRCNISLFTVSFESLIILAFLMMLTLNGIFQSVECAGTILRFMSENFTRRIIIELQIIFITMPSRRANGKIVQFFDLFHEYLNQMNIDF